MQPILWWGGHAACPVVGGGGHSLSCVGGGGGHAAYPVGGGGGGASPYLQWELSTQSQGSANTQECGGGRGHAAYPVVGGSRIGSVWCTVSLAHAVITEVVKALTGLH